MKALESNGNLLFRYAGATPASEQILQWNTVRLAGSLIQPPVNRGYLIHETLAVAMFQIQNIF